MHSKENKFPQRNFHFPLCHGPIFLNECATEDFKGT